MASLIDRFNSMTNVIALQSRKIDENATREGGKEKINREQAFSIREDLRDHVRHDAKRLTDAFFETYPADEQIPAERLDAIENQAVKLMVDLDDLKDRIVAACDHVDDINAVTERVKGIVQDVSRLLGAIAKQKEINQVLCAEGIHVLGQCKAKVVETRPAEEPRQSPFPPLYCHQLPPIQSLMLRPRE